MEIKGLGFIPLFLAFWCAAWLSAAYTLTVIHGHSKPLMYISETGVFFPENILFGFAFVGMSIATVVLTYLNYRFMLIHSEAFRKHHSWIQIILLAIAWSSCVATTVMAGFSMKDYPMTHRISAFIAFGLGGFYNLWQSIVLYKVPGIHRVLCHVRTASCAKMLTSVFIFIGSRVTVYTHLCEGDCEKISEVVVQIIEWFILLFILINVLSYYEILQHLSLTMSWKGFTISKREKNSDCGV